MYVYRCSEPGLWTVGFYSPDGEWHPESDHNIEENAAKRVHFLNGGTCLRCQDRTDNANQAMGGTSKGWA